LVDSGLLLLVIQRAKAGFDGVRQRLEVGLPRFEHVLRVADDAHRADLSLHGNEADVEPERSLELFIDVKDEPRLVFKAIQSCRQPLVAGML